MICPCCRKPVNLQSPYCTSCGVKYSTWKPGEGVELPTAPPPLPLWRRALRYVSVSGLLLLAAGAAWWHWGGEYSTLELDTLIGVREAWAKCPGRECLTVYVAPWSVDSTKSIPYIRELRDRLQERGVDMRVIVGMSDLKRTGIYAKQFGPDTFLDPRGLLHLRHAPHCFITDSRGRIVREFDGFPYGRAQTEMDEKDWRAYLHQTFGLL